MPRYVAKRIRLRNGERLSVLHVPGGLPVHEATLFLDGFRTKGRAANTIHAACCSLALLYRWLDAAKLDLMGRLRQGRFLTPPELVRLATGAQLRLDDLDEDERLGESDGGGKLNVISLSRIGFRRTVRPEQERKPVDPGNHATRIRYIAAYLGFLSEYVGPDLPPAERDVLARETARGLETLRAHIPREPSRATVDGRVGLSVGEQQRLLQVVHPDSPSNPWRRGSVQRRNYLIVVVLLASGMRRGELLGLQIGDLRPNESKLRILRRADAAEDPRRIQPNAKTRDREIELAPPIMRALWTYINQDRRRIKAARTVPQVFVSDDGAPLSLASIDRIFAQLREACPGLPVRLTSHVMRHTWNERFTEHADVSGLVGTAEERARNEQQGWSDNSKMAAHYTRRGTTRKGREVSLKLQEQLDAQLAKKN